MSYNETLMLTKNRQFVMDIIKAALKSPSMRFVFNEKEYIRSYVSEGDHRHCLCIVDASYMLLTIDINNGDGALQYCLEDVIYVPKECFRTNFTPEEQFQLSTVLTQEQLEAIPVLRGFMHECN